MIPIEIVELPTSGCPFRESSGEKLIAKILHLPQKCKSHNYISHRWKPGCGRRDRPLPSHPAGSSACCPVPRSSHSSGGFIMPPAPWPAPQGGPTRNVQFLLRLQNIFPATESYRPPESAPGSLIWLEENQTTRQAATKVRIPKGRKVTQSTAHTSRAVPASSYSIQTSCAALSFRFPVTKVYHFSQK